EQHVIIARLVEIAPVEAAAALNEDEPLPAGRLALDAQARLSVEAVLPRPELIPAQRRLHPAVPSLGVEHAQHAFLDRFAPAANDVAHEGQVDVRPWPPPARQPRLEKMQERMGVGSPPIGILRDVPGGVELGRGRVRLGNREVKFHQTARRAPEARALTKEFWIEKAVRAIASPFADERIVQRRERPGVLGSEPPAGVRAAPERPARQWRQGGHQAEAEKSAASRASTVGPNIASNEARRAASTAANVLGRPRSARLVTP